jgi:hypothetical protein
LRKEGLQGPGKGRGELSLIEETKKRLLQINEKCAGDRFKRMTLTMGILTEIFEANGLKPIIVGGLAVELYTQSEYTTTDIDFILDHRNKAGEILAKLGFEKRIGERYWYHPELALAIEIPDSVLAGDLNKLTLYELDNGTKIYLIGIEDLILDRLRACIYWKSNSDCEWAERLFALHHEWMDFDYLQSEARMESENTLFLESINRWKNQY